MERNRDLNRDNLVFRFGQLGPYLPAVCYGLECVGELLPRHGCRFIKVVKFYF